MKRSIVYIKSFYFRTRIPPHCFYSIDLNKNKYIFLNKLNQMFKIKFYTCLNPFESILLFDSILASAFQLFL